MNKSEISALAVIESMGFTHSSSSSLAYFGFGVSIMVGYEHNEIAVNVVADHDHVFAKFEGTDAFVYAIDFIRKAMETYK